MNKDGEQGQQGEHFGEGRSEETTPDFPRQRAAGREETDHIDDVKGENDGGSTDQMKSCTPLRPNAEALLTIRELLREVKARQ